jgi:hypothetical protein
VIATAISPTRIPTGFAHDVTRWPAALPTGTRPIATAPTAAPRANGTSTEEVANTLPSNRASLIVPAWPRSANAAPRKMIPTAAIDNGTYKVDRVEA